ncbi:MAG: PAS domain S-box protein [Chloroflexi bacterium]|nr:PAS domain S-box protein [Chloroflexota bacterium]
MDRQTPVKIRELNTELKQPLINEQNPLPVLNELSLLKSLSKLIIQTNNRAQLLEGACQIIREHGGFNDAWILLLNNGIELFTRPEIKSIDKSFLKEQTKPEKVPACINLILKQKEPLLIQEQFTFCNQCFNYKTQHDSPVMSTTIHFQGSTYGILNVSLSTPKATQEQILLIKEVTDQIAFALSHLDVKAVKTAFNDELDITNNKLSEMNLSNSLNSFPHGIAVFGDKGKPIYANEAFYALWCYNGIEEFESVPMSTRYTPESYAQNKERREMRMRGEIVPEIYENEIIRKDGKKRYIEIFSKNIIWDGQIRSMALYKDITLKRMAVEALQYSEQRYRDFANSLPQVVCELDINGNFTLINQAAIKATDQAPIDFARELNIEHIVIPEERSNLKDQLKLVLAGNTLKGSEFTLQRRDGTKSSALVYAAPLLKNGNIRGLRCIIIDISAKKQMEMSLQMALQKAKKYEEIINRSKSMVLRWRAEQGSPIEFTSENVSQLGYTSDDFMSGRISWIDITHPDDKQRLENELNVYEKKGINEFFQQYRLLDKNGNTRWMNDWTTVLRDNKGRVTHREGVILDVTESKKVAEQVVTLTTAINNSIDGVVIAEHSRGITYVNNSFAKMHGYTPEEMIGKIKLRELFSENSIESFHKIREEMTKTGTAITEAEHKRKDGSYFPVFTSSTIVKDENNNTLATVMVVRDITKRKKAEETLAISEKHYRDLANFLPQIVCEIDVKGKFTFVNQAAFTSTGYTWQNFVDGINIFQVIDPQNHDKLKQNLALRLQGSDIGGNEYNLIRKDGSAFPVLIYSSPLSNENKLSGLRCIAIDISERKKIEEALRQSEENFRNSLDHSPLGITIFDKNDKFLYVNKTILTMWGYSTLEELQGIPAKKLYTLQSYESNKLIKKKWLNGELIDRSEIEIISKNNEIRYFETFYREVLWDGKKHLLAMYHEITELKRIQDQLKHSQLLALLGEMTAGIAHEVNNPLGSILLFSELLMASEVPGQLKKDLDVIHSEAKRATKIMTDLLTYSRQSKPVMKRVELHSILRKVLDIYKYREKANNITVITDLCDELVFVKGNTSQLSQAFMNLVLNAEDIIKENNGGKLIIQTRVDKDWIRISIADDGSGIPSDNINKIFYPFFTTKGIGRGTGLGLSICYGIITSHNGIIRAENNDIGGATFIIELPILKNMSMEQSFTTDTSYPQIS